VLWNLDVVSSYPWNKVHVSYVAAVEGLVDPLNIIASHDSFKWVTQIMIGHGVWGVAIFFPVITSFVVVISIAIVCNFRIRK
jgi:hypothetical protein